MRSPFCSLLLATNLLLAMPTLAVVPVVMPEPEGPSVSLGDRPASGQEAFDGIPNRAFLVRRALACGNELTFIWDYNNALEVERSFGAQGNVRGADWPISHLVAKAATLAFRDNDTHDASCQTTVDATATREAWKKLLEVGTAPPIDEAVINKVYENFFGSDCANTVRRSEDNTSLVLTVSERCMMAQIRTVMLEDLHGPWSIDEQTRRRLPRYPGPTPVPCLA